MSFDRILYFANKAANIKVGRFGNSIVELDEVLNGYIKVLNVHEIIKKTKGKKVVFTNGCFDVIHAGHIDLLQKAKEKGDILVVGLNSDSSIRRLKGNSRPVNTLNQRIKVLSSIQYIDYIVVFDDDTPLQLIEAIKSEKLTPFGGIFAMMEQFDSTLSYVIDTTLGLRCRLYGYQYSEIIRSLMSIYFCGGSCIEDVTTHLMPHLSLHPTLRTCSSDTILRAIKELTQENISYTSDTGKNYDFNTADTLNTLLLNCMCAAGQLKEGEMYDVDFDHQFIETEKYDAKHTYKKFLGYRPGVAVIGDLIVGIENSDGNTNVRFHQKDTLKRFFERFEQNNLVINRFRADCGSCSEEIVEEVATHCKTFYIRANRCSSLYNDLFALRGWKRGEINGIEFELNSILVEKWKGKTYRLVIQRRKRMDGELDLWEGEYTYRCRADALLFSFIISDIP